MCSQVKIAACCCSFLYHNGDHLTLEQIMLIVVTLGQIHGNTNVVNSVYLNSQGMYLYSAACQYSLKLSS